MSLFHADVQQDPEPDLRRANTYMEHLSPAGFDEETCRYTLQVRFASSVKVIS